MYRRTRTVLAAAVAALSLAVAAAPASAGTLDQQQTHFNGLNFFAGPEASINTISLAQTFTAGLSGGLDQVDLRFATRGFDTEPVTVEIRKVDSTGAPGTTVLASASVPATDAGQPGEGALVPVFLASPPAVVAGTQYAIVVYTSGTASYFLGLTFDISKAYAGGAMLVSAAWPPTTGWNPPRGGLDLTFGTYVAPWNFTGFYDPVDNDEVNLAKAGSSIPVKFSLGGDQGPDVLADGFPEFVFTECNPGDEVDPVEDTSTANNGLTYDAATDIYTYVWKTSKNWKGKCGTFTLKLDDDSEHTAEFQFK